MTKRIVLLTTAGLAAGLVASAAVANTHRGNTGGERAEGAPGRVCAQHPRGSEAFRNCIRERAKARGRGVARACAQHPRGSEAFRNCVRERAQQRGRANGQSARGKGEAMRSHGIGRLCAQHERGSAAFRNCVRTQIQQRRAALRACKEQHRRGSEAFRNCIRAAKRP